MYSYERTVAKWLDVVKEHYGSIDNFEDAPSVRIMLNFCRQHKKGQDDIINSIIDDGAREEFKMLFQGETDKINEYETILKGWLDERSLPE